jgi:hypothetical protein
METFSHKRKQPGRRRANRQRNILTPLQRRYKVGIAEGVDARFHPFVSNGTNLACEQLRFLTGHVIQGYADSIRCSQKSTELSEPEGLGLPAIRFLAR